MNDFWLGMTSLPAALLLGLGVGWVAVKLWATIETWIYHNGPKRSRPHKLAVLSVDGPARYIVAFRPLARFFASYAVAPHKVSFRPLPSVTVFVAFGSFEGRGRPRTVETALAAKLGEIEDMEVPYPER